MARLPLLILLLVGFTAPLHAQSLVDAATAGAAQGSLNNMAMPGYGGTLKAARATLKGTQKPVDSYLGLPNGGGGTKGGSAAQLGSASSTPVAAGTVQPEVNGQVIGLCSSGQLCLSQIRRAMGLR
jgi:hypothetical protein